MNVLKLFIVVLMICINPFLQAQIDKQSYGPYTLRLKSGNYTPANNTGTFDKDKSLYDNCLYAGHYYVLLQFYAIPGEQELQALRIAGIKLHSYLPHYAYLASVPATITQDRLIKLNVRSIGSLPAEYKISRRFYEGNDTPTGVSRKVVISYYPGTPLSAILDDLDTCHAELEMHSAMTCLLQVNIFSSDLPALASKAWLIRAEPACDSVIDQQFYFVDRPVLRSNILQSTLYGKRGLTGKGVNISIYEGSQPAMHVDFTNRFHVQYTDPAAPINGYHADWCLAIAAGAGLRDPLSKGAAPEASLYPYNSAGSVALQDSLFARHKRLHISVTTNSWLSAYTAFGDYDIYSEASDKMQLKMPNLLNCFAAGNGGPLFYTVIGTYNATKNNMTVAASDQDTIASFSSRGPMADGRVKPDIAAEGANTYGGYTNDKYELSGGTSSATPGVAGVAALLYQRYRQLNSGNDPHAVLIKSVLMNSALDIGLPGPDYKAGYGRVDGLSAVQALENKTYLEDSVTHGNIFSKILTIPLGITNLKVMLSWFDQPGNPNAAYAITNDLDLRIVTPNNDTIKPWVLDPLFPNNASYRDNDSINTNEQVTLDLIASGTYKFLVYGKNVPIGPQAFVLTWKLDNNFIALSHPIGGETFSPRRDWFDRTNFVSNNGNNTIVSWQANGITNPFKIEYSSDNGNTWSTIGTASAKSRDFYWVLPTAFTSQGRIRVSSGSYSSDSDSAFAILTQPRITLISGCIKEVRISYHNIPGISSYRIFRLSSTGTWDVVGNTTDTFFTDSTVARNTEYWYTVAAIGSNNSLSLKAIAQKTSTSSLYCGKPNDAGIVNSVDQNGNYCPGAHPVSFTIRNYGTSTLTTARINWAVNGTLQTPYNWTGSLSTGDSMIISAGSFTFSASTAYILKAYTTLPNGGFDGDHLNDTFTSQSLLSGIAGTYTIGGSNPDFADFSSAVNTLHANGVCGPVTFKIRDGKYKEYLEIRHVPGSSAVNTVTFISESGDSSKVLLYNKTDTTWANAKSVLVLNGASNIRFKKISIQVLPDGLYGNSTSAVELANRANHNVFSQCRLLGSLVTPNYSYSAGAVVYCADAAFNNANKFEANLIKFGSDGMLFNLLSDGSKQDVDDTIRFNTIDSAFNSAINISYANRLVIEGNIVSNILNTDYSYGLKLSNCSDILSIARNNFHLELGASALALMNCKNNPAGPALISNNFISGNDMAVVSDYNGEYHDFIHNSICHNGAGDGNGLEITSNYSNSATYTLLDNIVVNKSGGYAFYLDPAAGKGAIKAMDFNDWYTGSNTSLGYFSGTIYNTLGDWKSASSLDSHSLNCDPRFKSRSDLHISSAKLYKSGIRVSKVGEDIDKTSRNLIPDIGAHEFTPLPNDAGVLAIDSPLAYFCGGTSKVLVQIENNGTNVLSAVKIRWTLNSVPQVPFNWSGSLLRGNAAQVQIGNISLSSGNIYTIKIWTELPNGVADGNNSNDTMLKANIASGLSGNYTIGGVNPDFATFTDAVKALTARGVCSAVVFLARDGNYMEQVSIGNIPGSSQVNTITFKSQNGDNSKVILYSDATFNVVAQATWKFNSSQYVFVEHITIARVGNDISQTDANVVGFEEGSRYNKVSHCRLIGLDPAYVYSGETQSVITAMGKDIDHNIIEGNLIRNGYSGIYWQGDYQTNGDDADTFRNNDIDSATYYGIYVFKTQHVVVDANMIHNIMDPKFGYGIFLMSCNEIRSVSRNSVMLHSAYAGLYMGACNNTSIPALVSNNFLSCGGSNNSYGSLYVDNCQGQHIIFNSIYNYSSKSGVSALTINNPLNLNKVFTLRNNIAYQSSGGYAITFFSASGAGMLTSMDYNNWYVNTSSSNLGYNSSVKCSNLAAWKSSTKKDSSTLSIDPAFNSADDLHIHNPSLANAGTTFVTATTDIDGKTRTVPPTIGAAEYHPKAYDAGISALLNPGRNTCPGATPVIISLRNYGTSMLTSAKIKWTVNGIAQKPYSWSGSMKLYDSAILTIGTYTFGTGGMYIVKVWTDSPNLVLDQYLLNDTLYKQGLRTGLAGTYTVGGASPDFKTVAEAADSLAFYGVCGPVVMNIRNGFYNERVTFKAIPGASASNTILFTSESGDSSKVIISQPTKSANAPSPVFAFQGASYITLYKLTLQRVQSSPFATEAVVISVGSHTSYVSVKNCKLLGISADAGYNELASIVYAKLVTNTDSLTFDRNTLINGYSGFYLNFLDTLGIGCLLSNNQIDSFYHSGIEMLNARTTVIRGNTIDHALATISQGIVLYSCYDTRVIEKNKISLDSGSYCLYLENCQNPQGTPLRISNNFFSSMYGVVYDQSGMYHNYYFNNIRCSSSQKYGFAIYIENNSSINGHLNIVNNIMESTGAAKVINLRSITGSKVFGSMDYNVFYSSAKAALAVYNAAVCVNIAAWQNFTGEDAHSIYLDPIYTSAGDLHVSNPKLYKTGMSINGIPDDIDGERRNSIKPTIGADEFIFNDVGIIALAKPDQNNCEDSLATIKIEVYNYNRSSQTDVPVKLEMQGPNGNIFIQDTLHILLKQGDTAILTFKNKINTLGGGTFNFKAYTQLEDDLDGSNDTLAGSFHIGTYPKVRFATRGLLCENRVISFSDSSTVNPADTIVYSLWRFGDGDSSFTANPVHQFANAGNYSISLELATKAGCKATASNVLHVGGTPKAAFNITGHCLGDSTRFINKSGPSTLPMNYAWNLGDGDTSANHDISHQYGLPGSYKVRLIAYTSGSCADTASQTAGILSTPTIKFQVNDSAQCFAGHKAVFEDADTSSGAYTLYTGDGNSYSSMPKAVVYNSPGFYQAKLVKRNTGGCVDSAYQTLRLLPATYVKLKVNDSTQCFKGHKIVFTDADTGQGGYTLYTGDGNRYTSLPSRIVYGSPGKYVARLVKANAGGCSDSQQVSLVILKDPKAAVPSQSLCVGGYYTFNALLTPGDAPINKVIWQSADSGLFSGNPYSRGFSKKGFYGLDLYISDTIGCTDTVKTVQNVHDISPPKIAISPSRLETGPTFVYDISCYPDSFVIYNWNIGSVGSYIVPNPRARFTDPDHSVEKIHLEVTSSDGCKASLDSSFVLLGLTKCYFPNAVSRNHDGLNEGFGIAGPEYIKEYSLQIFNRWGEMVFRTNDPYELWYPDFDMSTVYIYKAEVRDLYSIFSEVKGTFIVIK